MPAAPGDGALMQPIGENDAGRVLVWTVAVAYAAMAILVATDDIALDIASAPYGYVFAVGTVPFALYANWRGMKLLASSLACVAALLLLTIPIVFSTYTVMNLAMPLADARLAAMDAAIGFDWPAFVAWIDAEPGMARLLAYAYSSLPYQLLVLPLLLSALGQPVRAYALIFAYALACLISSIAGIWFPAVGAYPFHGIGQGSLSNINVWFGYHFLEQFDAVRADGPFVFVLDAAAGILTFPSVHAAAAALCAWAAWGSRWLRYPFLALNALMALSAVSHGSHYVIDVIAGFGVAGVAVSIATAVFYRHAEGQSPVFAAARTFRLRRSPASASG